MRFWVTYMWWLPWPLHRYWTFHFRFGLSLFCPEPILAFSSRLCASLAALFCVARTTHCHISKLVWWQFCTVCSSALPGPSYRRLPKITLSNSSTLIVLCYRHLLHILRLLLLLIPSRAYLNELVHVIGTPAKQTSSLNPAGLKYSVFFLLIISPFSSSTSLHLSSCCSTSNLDSSHITRSSAKSIAHGGSLWILLANTSIMIMKTSGLSVDPWCNPTSMLKYWVNPQRVFTPVLVALYISSMMVMYASGMFFFLNAHQIMSCGTRS